MSARPPIAVKRPTRPADGGGAPPTPIQPTAIPSVDPDSSDAMAFSMRGRNTGTDQGQGRGLIAVAPPSAAAAPTDTHPSQESDNPDREEIPAHGRVAAEDSEDGSPGLISIKLPPDVGRQLAALADHRGSKRTLIAIEALGGPLRALAAAHRSGQFPELPKIVSGSVRSSIAFSLPPDLAADLDFVLRSRRAVRAQVVTRLLAPAVRALYDSEIGRRRR